MNHDKFAYVRVWKTHQRAAHEARVDGLGLVGSHLVALEVNRPKNDVIFAIPLSEVDEWFEKRKNLIAVLAKQGTIVSRVYAHGERPKRRRPRLRDFVEAIRYGNHSPQVRDIENLSL